MKLNWMLSSPGPQSSTSSFPSANLLTHSTFDLTVIFSESSNLQGSNSSQWLQTTIQAEILIMRITFFYRVCFSQWLNFAGIAALASYYWGKSNTEKFRAQCWFHLPPSCACLWTVFRGGAGPRGCWFWACCSGLVIIAELHFQGYPAYGLMAKVP